MKIRRNEYKIYRLPIKIHLASFTSGILEFMEMRATTWPFSRLQFGGVILLTHEDENPWSVVPDEYADADLHELFLIEEILSTGIGLDCMIVSDELELAANEAGLDVTDCLNEAISDTFAFEALGDMRPFMNGPWLRECLKVLEATRRMLKALGFIPEGGWELAEERYGVTYDTIFTSMHAFSPWLPEAYVDAIVTQDGAVVEKDQMGEWNAWDYERCLEDWILWDEGEMTEADFDILHAERLADFQSMKNAWHVAHSKE